MAYFANGTSADIFQQEHCQDCLFFGRCPIWDLHFMWNYDAIGRDADETKAEALAHFIPDLHSCNMRVTLEDADRMKAAGVTSFDEFEEKRDAEIQHYQEWMDEYGAVR